MKCVMPGANIKVLAKAIHTLAKVGDEMYIQPLQNALMLKTVNMANSAYADFTFNENFFTYYNIGDLSDEDASKCKISLRSAMTVFKTPHVLEKQVEVCHIKISTDSAKVVFIMKYKNSIIKTHLLPIIDCDVLKATYNMDNVPNKLSIQPKVLSDIVQNFPQNLLEITLDVNDHRAQVRNYIDDNSNLNNETRTQLVLSGGDFDHYGITNHTAITFCLKELRALLHFAEGLNLVINVNFETAGRPVVIFLRNALYEATLVQSTLNPDTDSQSENSMPSAAEAILKRKAAINNSKKRQLKRTTKPSATKKPKKAPGSASKVLNESVSRLLRNVTGTEPATPKCNGRSRRVSQNLDSDEINSAHSNSRAEVDESMSNELSAMDVDDQEDQIPDSPKRSNKARMIFQKCFQTTFHPDQLPGHDEILAEDSDDDND